MSNSSDLEGVISDIMASLDDTTMIIVILLKMAETWAGW